MKNFLASALQIALRILISAASYFVVLLTLALLGGLLQITEKGFLLTLIYICAVIVLPIYFARFVFVRSNKILFKPTIKQQHHNDTSSSFAGNSDDTIHYAPPNPINTALVDHLVNCLSKQPVTDNTAHAHSHILDDFALYGGANAELLTIDLMDGHDFEYWCAAALEDMGFTDVEVTPGSGDQGVDILAKKNSIKYAIQCKRYTDDLGNTPIQEVHAGKALYHCHVGVVITNRYFTSGAKQLAEATGVLLWDRDWIIEYLDTKSDENGAITIQHDSPVNPVSAPQVSSYDDLLLWSVDVLLETGLPSVSMLQRRLQLDYARAARIMVEMEELGIVSPLYGSQPRKMYITTAEWTLVKARLNHQ